MLFSPTVPRRFSGGRPGRFFRVFRGEIRVEITASSERQPRTMQLTIERAALLKALGHVQSVVERRNTIPILSNVLLSAERDSMALSATDLDMEIIDETQGRVDGQGQITAPAHTLYEIVRKLPDGAEVELRYTGDDPRRA